MKIKIIDSKLNRSGSHQDAVNAFLDTLMTQPKEITTTVISGHGDHGGVPQIVTVIMHYGIKEK